MIPDLPGNLPGCEIRMRCDNKGKSSNIFLSIMAFTRINNLKFKIYELRLNRVYGVFFFMNQLALLKA